jgi:ubiquinol-cytochrome c reductase cytochrome c1 subunit
VRAISAALLFLVACAATGSEVKLTEVELDRSPAALRRGANVVVNVCMGCHSLRYVRYRDLSGVGLSAEDIATLRGDRAPEDVLMGAMDDAMAAETFGRVPPDQSTLAKARVGGAQFIYSFVTAYETGPDGAVANRLIPETKMPDVFGYATASAADRAAAEQQARDAAVFLEWASDPRAAERKSIGAWVLGYLVVLTILLYLVKRRVWRGLPPLNTA